MKAFLLAPAMALVSHAKQKLDQKLMEKVSSSSSTEALELDVQADVTRSLLHKLNALGGNITRTFPAYQRVKMRLFPAMLPEVAALDEVHYVTLQVRSARNQRKVLSPAQRDEIREKVYREIRLQHMASRSEYGHEDEDDMTEAVLVDPTSSKSERTSQQPSLFFDNLREGVDSSVIHPCATVLTTGSVATSMVLNLVNPAAAVFTPVPFLESLTVCLQNTNLFNVTIRIRVRLYANDNMGAPGTFIRSRSYEVIMRSGMSCYGLLLEQMMPSSFWAGIWFDNYNQPSTTISQMEKIGIRVNGPVQLGGVTGNPVLVQPSATGFSGSNPTVASTIPLDAGHGLAFAMRNLNSPTVSLGQGSAYAESDFSLRGDLVRSTYSTMGTGFKIGVLSDGASPADIATAQATGDLPPGSRVTVISDIGAGSEGIAMMELMHDIAPGADFVFSTAFDTIESFAADILQMQTMGCQIIVDDVWWEEEFHLQDGAGPSQFNGGIVQAAVNQVSNAGVLYLSAAGNDQNQVSGSGMMWSGDFADGGDFCTAMTTGGYNLGGPCICVGCRVHEFSPGVIENVITRSAFGTFLTWSNALNNALDDYDLYRFNSARVVTEVAANAQNGPGFDPREFTLCVGYTDCVINGERVVIVKKRGMPRYIKVFVAGNNGNTLTFTRGSSIFGHAASTGNGFLSVAAAASDVSFTTRFSSNTFINPYSSDGPARLFFDGTGAPYTPGDLSSTGGRLVQAPHLTGADGVSVSGVGGFGKEFYGTSAAAPSVAAIAALVWQRFPAQSSLDVKTALINGAILLPTLRKKRAGTAGAGVVNGLAAAAAACPVVLGVSPSVPVSFSFPGPGMVQVTVSNPGANPTGPLVVRWGFPGLPQGIQVISSDCPGLSTSAPSYSCNVANIAPAASLVINIQYEVNLNAQAGVIESIAFDLTTGCAPQTLSVNLVTLMIVTE